MQKILVCLALVVFFLSGCFGIRPFQPPPPQFKMWSKPGVSEEEVKRTMLSCGYPHIAGTNRDTSPNAGAAMFVCMRKNGFKDTQGFELCQYSPNLPACVEYIQGRPLTIEQLEQLPYKEDIAFAKSGPEWNIDTLAFVNWHKEGASELFTERFALDSKTVQVMYKCGYPNPLGSGTDVTNNRAAEIHKCMEDKGYIGKASAANGRRLFPICKEYPRLRACYVSDDLKLQKR